MCHGWSAGICRAAWYHNGASPLFHTVWLTSNELHILGADGRMEVWIIGSHEGLIKCDELHPLFCSQTEGGYMIHSCSTNTLHI